MKLSLYWVDAFTDRVFAGNPAAVMPLESWLDNRVLQQIAFENGLAETAFLVRRAEGRFDLRWFTPAVEVDLFAPQSGINEDPVTGSAHCVLTPYWARQLGRTHLHARQLSLRGGELWCEHYPATGSNGRVRIAGHAVPYLRAEVTI